MHREGDPGIWLTRKVPRLAYWSLPKCGCSSVKQLLHYLDTGTFFDGYIHDLNGPLLNSATPQGRAEIGRRPESERPFGFTFARNPFSRLASCFADKIVGFPSKGRRYLNGAVHENLAAYGVDWGPKANLVSNFRRFVRFAEDTILRTQPMAPDPHWAPAIVHLRNAATVYPNWGTDFVGHVEDFRRDVDSLYRRAGIKTRRAPQNIPRANESSLFGLSLSDLYGPDEVRTVQDVYEEDFRHFHYSGRLDQRRPLSAVDPDEINAVIHQPPVHRPATIRLVPT